LIAQGFAVIIFASADLLFTVTEMMWIAAGVIPLVFDDVSVLKDDIEDITSRISIVVVVKVDSLLTESPKVEMTGSNKVTGKMVPLKVSWAVNSL
jgi:hypothetical protein